MESGSSAIGDPGTDGGGVMARPGFMIYHEDGKMLKYADDTTLANVIRNLIDFSMGLEESGEIPHIESDNGIEIALYDSMIQKIVRDSGKYDEEVKEQSIRRKIGHLQNCYKAKGIKKSKEAIRLEAEEWYTKEYRGKPGYSNCNVPGTVTQAPTITPTVTETITGAVAERSEAENKPPELQQIIEVAERRGVKMNERVIGILFEEYNLSSEDEVIRKMTVQPNFLQRLKMLGGTA